MTAMSDILSDNDSLSVVVQSLDAKVSLRSASIVNHSFHVAVRNERTRRLASIHKQYAYIGGGADKARRYSEPPAVARIDVVGRYETHLPPLVEALIDTSAEVLDNGRIVVVGNRDPPVVYVFEPKHWRWYKVSAPNALAMSTIAPYPGGRFAAIGGYDDEYSSKLCIYSPVQGEPFLYEEEVESLEFACCGPAALTRRNGQTTFLVYHENEGNEIGESVMRPPLVFPDRTSGVLEKLPRSVRYLCANNNLEPSAAWLSIDVKDGATPAVTEVAVVVQPTASQKKALVWMSLPHGSWRKVAFMSVDAAASPNDDEDASDDYMFDMLNPPRPAIVVLNGERHLAFAACLWDSDNDHEYYDVWMGATLRDVLVAMTLRQGPASEDEDEEGFEARGLVPMRNLSGMIHTPIRHQSCLLAFAPY